MKVAKKKIQKAVNIESCRPYRKNAEVQDDEGTTERGGTGRGAEVWRSEKDMKQSTKNATLVIPTAREEDRKAESEWGRKEETEQDVEENATEKSPT